MERQERAPLITRTFVSLLWLPHPNLPVVGPELEALQILTLVTREEGVLERVVIVWVEEFISARVLVRVGNRSLLVRALMNKDTLCCLLRSLRGIKPNHLVFSLERDFSTLYVFNESTNSSILHDFFPVIWIAQTAHITDKTSKSLSYYCYY